MKREEGREKMGGGDPIRPLTPNSGGTKPQTTRRMIKWKHRRSQQFQIQHPPTIESPVGTARLARNSFAVRLGSND
jgi:hypothetical protein